MSTDVQRFFRDQDLQAVRAAVAAAEEATGGEIVTYVVGRCDPYEEARWKGAALGAVFLAAAAGLAHWAGGFWGGWGVAWISLPATLGALVGYGVAAAWPALARRLVDEDTLERRVRFRAETAFLDEEVFATRDRTGVLIFLALFEHKVVVLADAGIHAHVEPREWEGVARDLAAGIRQGRPAAALVTAVERCGRLLEKGGVPRRPADRDELPDAVRLRDD